MGLDFRYTCPEINRNITYAKDTIYSFLKDFAETIKNLDEDDDENFIINDASDDLYKDIENLFEDIRSLNEDIRSAADEQIDSLEIEKDDLETRVNELDEEIYELKYKLEHEGHE